MILQGKTILLVEDDPLISRMLELRLHEEGAQVLLAFNGVEGLEKLHANTVQVAILDVMMPKMNGFEMIKRMKADPTTRDVPIIVFTNLNDRPDEIEKIKQAGVKDYIVKADIKLAEVVKRVAAAME